MSKKTSNLFQESEKSDTRPIVPEDEIIDVDIAAIKKKRIRINGDNNKILELNISDMGIASRLSKAYKELMAYMDNVSDAVELAQDEDGNISDEAVEKLSNTLDAIDNEMRKQVDYIFKANVSAICADDGSMWDPLDGEFRFEHIILTLTGLYENKLSDEFEKLQSKVEGRATKIKALKGSKYHN